MMNIEANAVMFDTYVDSMLTATPTPWYLKAEDLYQLSKKAIGDLKIGEYAMAQKAIDLVNKSTQMVAKNLTSFTIEEGFDVIKVVDETLTNLLPKADAAIDATHMKFLESLKGLKDATKARMETIYSKLSVEELKASTFQPWTLATS